MGFLKRLKDVASGRIARSNRIIGNHGVRICEKLETHANPLLEALVVGIATCTIQFLEAVLFDVKDFKYNDGTGEPNPFKENLDRLDEKSSYEMFKLVAGNFLIVLFAEGLLRDDETRINIPELRDQFLEGGEGRFSNVILLTNSYALFYRFFLSCLRSLLLSLFPKPLRPRIPHFRRLCFQFGFQPFLEVGPGNGQRAWRHRSIFLYAANQNSRIYGIFAG